MVHHNNNNNNMTTIKASTVVNYVIVWNHSRTQIKAYSILNIGQQLQTKSSEVDSFTNEAEWLEILLENGINPNEEI